MKSLDAFARPVQEFQVKTNCGGYLSLCSFFLIAVLFVTELRYFLEPETKDHMFIDQNQEQKYVNISINITFPAAPCAVLQLNLLDPKRANILHINTEIYKTRLGPGLRPAFGRRIRDALADVAQTSEELLAAGGDDAGSVASGHSTTRKRCPSCFGAQKDEGDCCPTCSHLRHIITANNLGRPSDYEYAQCAEEVYVQAPPQEGEGCRIEALLRARKVPAILHIGVGRHFDPKLLPGTHRTDFAEQVIAKLDFSHEVQGLSFGPPFPGLVDVLAGRKKANYRAGGVDHHQYDIHVIPTQYVEDGGTDISSHQYSVTEYTRRVNTQYADTTAAGLWMSYTFTPFEVRVTRSRKSLWHFLTECCAILGGIFAFTGILDKLAYRVSRVLAASGAGLKAPLADGRD
mmetsp:Transcript_41633/g.109906  ORF Transcript_41633/g.109906 Transcript_41633/m.109906 type:complete len:403 (-) Transcript_41633:47-1255(-)